MNVKLTSEERRKCKYFDPFSFGRKPRKKGSYRNFDFEIKDGLKGIQLSKNYNCD